MEQGPVQAHGGGAGGRQSGDCAALFFSGGYRESSIHAWRGSTDDGPWVDPRMRGCRGGGTRTTCPKNKRPRTAGRLPSEVPTSDRAGTGGIQMFLSDIDVELFAAARVVFVTL
ncbi:hypothetical protein C7E18_13050 [Stenotrophomonas maltophilia]|nr:hypothetical protein C7E18_13050 [Stenotrophomonas maltophilia]